jgi:hypothetical protein
MSNENRIATEFYEAAFSPAEWSNALGSLAHWLDAVGAAYIIFNKESKEVDWACFHGPSAELKPEYVSHYASLDPYSPILKDLSTGTWTWLSDPCPARSCGRAIGTTISFAVAVSKTSSVRDCRTGLRTTPFWGCIRNSASRRTMSDESRAYWR